MTTGCTQKWKLRIPECASCRLNSSPLQSTWLRSCGRGSCDGGGVSMCSAGGDVAMRGGRFHVFACGSCSSDVACAGCITSAPCCCSQLQITPGSSSCEIDCTIFRMNCYYSAGRRQGVHTPSAVACKAQQTRCTRKAARTISQLCTETCAITCTRSARRAAGFGTYAAARAKILAAARRLPPQPPLKLGPH